MSEETRQCQNCKNEFRIEPEDFLFYEKIKVPPPTWCPECRMIRRFTFRNQHNLFRRKDDRTGEEIFSGLPPYAPRKVYELSYWNSDSWDSMEYGREYDFTKPFLEQFHDLWRTVPVPSRSVLNLINSDYCNEASELKNCYLCFDSDVVENSAYLIKTNTNKDSMDLYEALHNELCYDSVMIDESYRAFFSVDCDNCTDVWFSKSLVGCTNCFGCVNLRNKSYHIFNQPYSKEAYEEKLKKFRLDTYNGLKEARTIAHEFWDLHPVKFYHGYHNVNSTGEHIQDCKNVKNSFSIHHGEDLRYCQIANYNIKDSYDYTVWGAGAEKMYEALACGFECAGVRFSFDCWPGCREFDYCVSCRSSSDLFGCIALKKKQYCILNKQYSKEEYEALREKIITHMHEMPYTDAKGRVYRYGEFFPPEFSPFGYGETQAQDFFPLTKDEVLKKGYRWSDSEKSEFATTINATTLPDTIREVSESILQEVIKCGVCAGAYRIIPMEFEFYRKMNLPLPRLCPNCRFAERFKFVNPPKFWKRICQCAGASDDKNIYQNQVEHFHGSEHCPNEFETSYAPERKEIVYCESCYQTEVV